MNFSLKMNSFYTLLTLILIDQLGVLLTFPVLTFAFFDSASYLLPADFPYHLRSFWYGAAIGIASTSQIFLTPIMGYLSDLWGRKKLLLLIFCCGLLFALGSAWGILMSSLTLFMGARFIGGQFSRSFSVAHAAVGDLSTVENKAINMARLQLTISIGACIGPLLGGLLIHGYWFKLFNFSLPFFVDALLAVFSILIILFFFQETNPPLKETAQPTFQESMRTVKNKEVLHTSIILILGQFSWSTYYQFIGPVLKTEFSFSATQIGLFLSLVALWLAIANTVGIRFLIKFFNLQQIIRYASIGMLIGLLATDLTSMFKTSIYAKYILWMAAAPMAFCDMLTFIAITTLYSNAVPQKAQGKAMGICFTLTSLVWASTGFLSGILGAHHPMLPFMIAPIGALFLIMLATERFIPMPQIVTVHGDKPDIYPERPAMRPGLEEN